LLQITLTFFFVVIGWIIFRAESMTQALSYLKAMVSNNFMDLSMVFGKDCLVFSFLLLLVEWLQRDKQHALQFGSNKIFNYRFVRWGIYYLILLVICKYAGSSQTFIYFQF
jgi:hypothetical protein